MSEALLRFDPFLDIAAVFINFIFIILVLVRTSRSTVFIIFSFVCISVMYWSFCSFLAHVTGTRNWFYLSQAGAAAIPTFTFHFIVALVRPGKSNCAWLVPAYFFSFLLGAVAFLAPIYPKARDFIEGSAWDISYLIFLSPLFFGGLMVLLKALEKAGSKNEKSRLWYFLIAGIIGLISAVTDHVQTLKVPVPALGHIGSVFYPAILVLGIFKHRTAYDILAQTRMKLDALNEIAAGIAHEIRNPLGSIKGASKLLARQMENSVKSEGRQYLEIIAEEIDRLDNILSNFQYLAKPLKIEKQSVSINEVILKTLKLVENDTLVIRIKKELTEVRPLQADASMLKQVFLNLIKNASEACGQAGELVIRTENAFPWVKITFEDNGPGIQPSLLERVFEPFFTTKESGIGVGLAICRRIVQAHEGRMEVENLFPKGARFLILLP